jgi:hypothetical protein
MKQEPDAQDAVGAGSAGGCQGDGARPKRPALQQVQPTPCACGKQSLGVDGRVEDGGRVETEQKDGEVGQWLVAQDGNAQSATRRKGQKAELFYCFLSTCHIYPNFFPGKMVEV